MTQRLGPVLSLALLFAAAGCDPNHPRPAPPPPPMPAPAPMPLPNKPEADPAPTPAPAEVPSAPIEPTKAHESERGGAEPAKAAADTAAKGSHRGESLYDLAREGKATLPSTTPPATAKPTPTTSKPVATTTPAPKPPVAATPAPTPVAPKPTGKVVVPRTAHVHVDVPPALQANLDADPRMQPWVQDVIGVADKCFTKARSTSPSAAGVIQVKVTMHENERPDADVLDLPPALSAVVACATGSLMRIKMPLFTGKEGQKHLVKIHFE